MDNDSDACASARSLFSQTEIYLEGELIHIHEQVKSMNGLFVCLGNQFSGLGSGSLFLAVKFFCFKKKKLYNFHCNNHFGVSLNLIRFLFNQTRTETLYLKKSQEVCVHAFFSRFFFFPCFKSLTTLTAKQVFPFFLLFIYILFFFRSYIRLSF